MADVTLTYKGSTILSLEDSATKTIKTSGKFCEGDIGVSYVKPSGGGEVYAAISVTYPEGSVCTATNGTTMLTAADTSGQVVFGIPEPSSTPETWTVSCTDGTDTDSTTVDIEDYGQIGYVTLAYRHIYGVSWAGTSSPVWSRTDEAASFTDPVPYVDGATYYGSPFDNIYPWSDMIRVTDSNAGEMVKIPKFWYKLTQNGNGLIIQIADSYTQGFSVCPACMDRGDGNGERDYILIGRYLCSSSNYKSANNIKPKVGATRSTFRTSARNLGTGINIMDFATLFTIWLLYLVEFANWNSQSTIGYGCGNASNTYPTGYTNSMPYHTGTTKASRTYYGYGIQYRYIEGLWDNVREWIDGCYYNSNGLNVIINPQQFSDNQNGINIGKPATGSSGTDVYPTTFSVVNVNGAFPAFIPNGKGGSTSYYSCDAWLYVADTILNIGGYYGQTQDYGLFYITANGASKTYDYVGSRLMKLP